MITKFIREKLNPAQPFIAGGGGSSHSSTEPITAYQRVYENIEIVNRGVNMLVDDASEIPVTVVPSKQIDHSIRKGVKASTVDRLLNKSPNEFQDIHSFKRNIVIDLIIDGNVFLYYDENNLQMYHLPAADITIDTDETKFIKSYTYKGGAVVYDFDEVIHIKDNSFKSIFRGSSRLRAAYRTIIILERMRNFQDNFFQNGAVPGLIITTPNTLSTRIKEKLKSEWSSKYNPKAGGRYPMILDGGLGVDKMSKETFKDLDFSEGVKSAEDTILKALGVPPILVDSGNNANIRPNHRLYYLETIIPIVKKINSAYSKYFGYEIIHDVSKIEAMQQELDVEAKYHTSLVNAGIETPNEARVSLALEKGEGEEYEDLRIPANIAGSATDPTLGGRPSEGEKE